MPKQVRLRRGTTGQHATFTGADGEVTFDTEKKCLVVHDGATPGGKALDGFLRLNPGEGVPVQTVTSALSVTGVDGSGFGLTVTELANLNGGASSGQRFTALGFRSLLYTVSCNGSFALHFTLGDYQLVTLLADTAFSTGVKYSGTCIRALLVAGAASRNLSWPAGWKWLGGAAPTSLAANKVALLEVFCWGSTDSDITARYTAQP